MKMEIVLLGYDDVGVICVPREEIDKKKIEHYFHFQVDIDEVNRMLEANGQNQLKKIEMIPVLK